MASEARSGTQPLAGIRVADFSRVLAGPYATMMLADFGADVIKIEPPTGDDTRAWQPPVDQDGEATYFASVNRGKRSVVCDLARPAGLARARELALGADVVVENFRPGVMAKFGLDYDSVHEASPRTIYCSITGFGDGAGATLPGYDLLVQAVGGLMSITGQPDGDPTKVGVALVDVITGLNALSGILLALRQRGRTGEGTRVRVNLLSSLLSALVNQASSTLATGVPPRRMGNAHPSIAPYELFRALDGDLVIAVGNDRQFAALSRVLGLAPEARLARNAERVAARAQVRAAIERRLATAPAAHWAGLLAEAGVPAGQVNTVAEAVEFAARLGLEPTRELRAPGRSTRVIANPIRLDDAPCQYQRLPPRLDADVGADWQTETPAGTEGEP